jgi:heme exporter protein CcmD
MSSLGEHAGFILAAYVLAALTVVGLVARAMLDHRGARRRSEGGAGRPPGATAP